MSEQAQPKSLTLRRTSSKLRCDSLRSRLDLIATFCSLAEAGFKLDAVVEVKSLIDRIHYFINELDRHIKEPHYIPEDQVPLLQDQLDQLVRRVSRIERRLRLRKTQESPGHRRRSHP